MEKTYYIAEIEISFGFGGFKRGAFLTREQAESALDGFRSSLITDKRIYTVNASNKKTALERAAHVKSLYAGAFAGIDSTRF